jgi:hypothetical protein
LTKVKSTSSFAGTVVAVAVLATIAYGMGIGRPVREDTETQLILEVEFSPAKVNPGVVEVLATVEGAPIAHDRPTKSIWSRGEWVPRGSKVIIDAWLPSDRAITDVLACKIFHNGKQVNQSRATGFGKSYGAHCEYRVP